MWTARFTVANTSLIGWKRLSSQDDGGGADSVYLVARVFGVNQSRMGLKLYLDPWKMRRNHELRFEAQVYSVIAC